MQFTNKPSNIFQLLSQIHSLSFPCKNIFPQLYLYTIYELQGSVNSYSQMCFFFILISSCPFLVSRSSYSNIVCTLLNYGKISSHTHRQTRKIVFHLILVRFHSVCCIEKERGREKKNEKPTKNDRNRFPM